MHSIRTYEVNRSVAIPFIARSARSANIAPHFGKRRGIAGLEASTYALAGPSASEWTALKEQLGLLPEARSLDVITVTGLHDSSRMQSMALRAKYVIAYGPTTCVMSNNDDFGLVDVKIIRVVLKPLHGELLVLDTKGIM